MIRIRRNALFAVTQLIFLVIATFMLWLSKEWAALILLVDLFFVVVFFRRDLFSQKAIADNARNNEQRELDEEDIVNTSKTNISSIENYEPYYGVEVPMGSFEIEYGSVPAENEVAYNTEAEVQEVQTYLPNDAQGDTSEIDDPASKPIVDIESAFKVVHNPAVYTIEEKTTAAKTIEDITPTTLMQDIMANKEVQERIRQLMSEIHS